MKKCPVFIFLFLLVSTILSAQDYRNIITNGSAFYSGTSNEAGFLSGVKAESKYSLGNGDTLFIGANTIRKKYSASNSLDTIGGILGEKIIKQHTGLFWFFNTQGDTIVINSGAVINDSRKFCDLPLHGQIRATCSSIEPVSFLGTTDLVKEFTFQAIDSNGVNILNFYNGKSIQLSQKYGLLRTFDLYHMPDSTGVFTLEGKNTPAIGFLGMTWHDVYDFEIGDEFQIVGTENFLWGNHPSTREYTTMKKVLAKQVAPGQGTVTYTFEFCKEVTEGTPMGVNTTYSSDTIQESFQYSSTLSDPTINWLPEQFDYSDYRYYSTLYHLAPGKPAYGFSGNYYQCCWSLNPYFNLYIKNDLEWAKGLGQVHYKNYWMYFNLVKYDEENLVYFKKGNEQWGSPVYPDCSAMIPYIASSPDTLFLGSGIASRDTLFITSNSAWHIINIASIDWAAPNTTTGSGNRVVSFVSTHENLSITARMATFVIESPGGYSHVILSQAGRSAGIDDKFPVNISISPNPLKKTATLTFTGLTKKQEKQLTIFDFTGRLVFKDSFNAEMYLFDRGALVSGIYVFNVSFTDGKPSSVMKVIFE